VSQVKAEQKSTKQLFHLLWNLLVLAFLFNALEMSSVLPKHTTEAGRLIKRAKIDLMGKQAATSYSAFSDCSKVS
jgi:hypothetical protein